MHALSRALDAVGSRSRALAAIGLVLSSLAPAPARADEPAAAPERAARGAAASDAEAHDTEGPQEEPSPSRDGPLVLRLALENDNLLLGNYARMVGRELDGTDLGRTHTGQLMVGYDVDDRVALRLDLSTELYTTALEGREPGRNELVPVHFHELDRLRLGARLGQRDQPWRVRFGIAGEISDHDHVTVGGTGQQRAWHDFLANTLQNGAWRFEHRPSGLGVRVGVAFDGSAGGRTEIALAPWVSLTASGDGGARLATIFAGSALTAQGRIGAVFGDRRGVRLIVAVEQHAHLWLEQAGVTFRSTVDVRFDLGVAALEVAVHRYDGDQNVPYYFYVEPNTTMTIALVGRL